MSDQDRNSRLLVVLGLVFVGLVVVGLAFDTYVRSRSTGGPNNEQSSNPNPTTALKAGGQKPGVHKEATCKTTPGSEQASMDDTSCAFIAANIPVLPGKTDEANRSQKEVPSPALAPGSNVPADVGELKPLPEAVTTRLPALKDDRYYLAGQDIVVVDENRKIAFVVNVKVRP